MSVLLVRGQESESYWTEHMRPLGRLDRVSSKMFFKEVLLF